LITGNFHQFWVQLVGIAAAAAYAAAVTTIILLVLKATMGLRVSREEEITGLDQSAHSETGYNF
jgi:Amt family ammonium transporter